MKSKHSVTKLRVSTAEREVLLQRMKVWREKTIEELENLLVAYISISANSALASASVLVINRLIEQKA